MKNNTICDLWKEITTPTICSLYDNGANIERVLGKIFFKYKWSYYC
ncbi:MAG TPA: hypothetical protein VFU79_06070 [Nitrososphaeraceae archaeon]|nr:hypothetical protein [Nitrososphaeraceae archaeon]